MAVSLSAAAAILLLLGPVPIASDSHPVLPALALSFHVLLFGAWAAVAVAALRGRIPRVWIWLALVAAAGVLEVVQPLAGRSREWGDWLAGSLGAGWMCIAAPRWGHQRALAGLGALALLPAAWTGSLLGLEIRAFPLLARPGSLWSRQGWTRNAVCLSVSSESLFRIQSVPPRDGPVASYPGLFRRAAAADWSRAGDLTTRLYWPDPDPALWAIRIDDRPGHSAYAERFQQEFAVTQGWNAIRIPATDWGRASGGRPLDVAAIRQWGVFLVSPGSFDYVLLDSVQLEMPQETP